MKSASTHRVGPQGRKWEAARKWSSLAVPCTQNFALTYRDARGPKSLRTIVSSCPSSMDRHVFVPDPPKPTRARSKDEAPASKRNAMNLAQHATFERPAFASLCAASPRPLDPHLTHAALSLSGGHGSTRSGCENPHENHGRGDQVRHRQENRSPAPEI
jgi:hypothetical protein